MCVMSCVCHVMCVSCHVCVMSCVSCHVYVMSCVCHVMCVMSCVCHVVCVNVCVMSCVCHVVCVTLKDDEEVKSVTQQFCEWVASLGGDSNNIDEATITSLFSSGYETKPALSVPIQVMELANVPPELRLSATLLPAPPTRPATVRPPTLGCARVC